MGVMHGAAPIATGDIFMLDIWVAFIHHEFQKILKFIDFRLVVFDHIIIL